MCDRAFGEACSRQPFAACRRRRPRVGPQRAASGRVLVRCVFRYLQIDTGPRRLPSACSKTLKKKRARPVFAVVAREVDDSHSLKTGEVLIHRAEQQILERELIHRSTTRLPTPISYQSLRPSVCACVRACVHACAACRSLCVYIIGVFVRVCARTSGLVRMSSRWFGDLGRRCEC